MGDPLTMAMIGAGVGAITNPRKPLQGALLGGALGGFGGAAMGAGNAAATATMTGASAVPAVASGLGCWVSKQRQCYANKSISMERKQLLDDIGFVWKPFDDAWRTMFDELKEYKAQHGHCNVPQGLSGLGK